MLFSPRPGKLHSWTGKVSVARSEIRRGWCAVVVVAAAARMSLMDLLEDTDKQMGVVGSRYTMGDEDDDEGDREEAEDDGSEEEGGGVEVTYCVCIVRHKGSVFIPCEHTFCRLCSIELLVQRSNCPMCNGYILEILDSFIKSWEIGKQGLPWLSRW